MKVIRAGQEADIGRSRTPRGSAVLYLLLPSPPSS
jgi:hypothetical protein